MYLALNGGHVPTDQFLPGERQAMERLVSGGTGMFVVMVPLISASKFGTLGATDGDIEQVQPSRAAGVRSLDVPLSHYMRCV